MRAMHLWFALLITTGVGAQTLPCANLLQMDSGYVYGTDRIADFVSKEIRPALSRVDRPFTVRVIRRCPGSGDQVAEWGMRTGTLYIVRWGSLDLADEVVRYTDDELEISAATFDQAVVDALRFDQLALKDRQRTLKMFAFVVAEGARFSDVEAVTARVLNGRCAIQWSEYARLLRSWKLISIFANSKALLSGTPYIGGSRAFLIAPITHDMVSKYNAALQMGWGIEDGEYEPAAPRDPVRYTARVGPVVCPTP